MQVQDSITLFQQFVEVLVALLTHPQTPAPAVRHFQAAAVAFVSEASGTAPDVAALRPALLRAFAAHLAGTAREAGTAEGWPPNSRFALANPVAALPIGRQPSKGVQ